MRADLISRNSGGYRQRCAIIRPVYSTARDGTSVVTWTLHGWRHMCVEPVSAGENRIGPRVLMESEAIARMPWERGIRSDMRVLFPQPSHHLSADASNVATVFSLTAALSGPPLRSGPFYARCESELVRVTGGHETALLTVQRGACGTSATAHETGVLLTPLREYLINGVIDAEEGRAELLLGLNGAQP